MTTKPIIKLQGIGKKYRIGESARHYTLSDALSALPSLWLRRRDNSRRSSDFWALEDVSFELNAGEVLGVIGKNGSGKSTLLKILSRITLPTTGRAVIAGRVASLLEVGTGFSPELTGRENIFLNGAILGMSRWEIKSKFDEIVAFSGVERFIDTPVKRYSSGMYVRLAFAVAAHLESEILLVDEVLAVGDAEFQKKCLGKMSTVARSGRTIIFVSHNMGSMRKLCSKGIVMDNGRNSSVMKIDKAIDLYLFSQLLAEDDVVKRVQTKNKVMEFFNLKINQSSTDSMVDVFAGDPIRVSMDYVAEKYPFNLVVSFGLRSNRDGNLVIHTTNMLADVKHITTDQATFTATLKVPHLAPGAYTLEMEAWLDSKMVLSTTPIGSLMIQPVPFFESRVTFPSFPSSILIKSQWQFSN